MKRGIALLITLFFVMAITLSMGIGFKYIKDTKDSVSEEQFLLQTSALVDDIQNILKNSKQLKEIKNSEDLSIFLAESSFIPLQYKNTQITLEFSSARGRLNINVLKDKQRLEIFKNYLLSKMVVVEFADILLDSMSGIKEDLSYRTDIFNDNPNLFRDYVASDEHLDKLLQIYKNKYHDKHIEDLKMEKLFFADKDTTTKVDLNFATSEVFQLMLGCSKERADELNTNAGSYKELEDLHLNDDEKKMISKFKYSFYEPHLNIKLSTSQNNKHQSIEFRYDLI